RFIGHQVERAGELSTQPSSELILFEWVLFSRSIEEGPGIENIIAEELPGGAMHFLATAAGNNVDSSTGVSSELGCRIGCNHAEFIQCLQGYTAGINVDCGYDGGAGIIGV